jgi:hypothetical protein
MRDMGWRIGLTLAVLIGLLASGVNASCSRDGLLVGAANGQAPAAQVSALLAAIAEGDRIQAMSYWADFGSSPALAARRETTIDELLAYGARLEYHVLDVEWWRSATTPVKVDDPSLASGARLQVAVSSDAKPLQIYHFDLLAREETGRAGNGRAHWVVIDVYPDGSPALAWPWR